MTNSLFKRTLIVLFGNGFSKAALLIFEFLIAGQLGASSYGRYVIGISLLMLVASLSLCGLEHGIIQYLSIFQEEKRRDKINELIKGVLRLVAVLSLSVGLLVAFAAPLLANHVFRKPELTPMLLLVGLAIPFEAFNQTVSAIFRGFRSVKDSVVVTDLIRNLLLLLYGLTCFIQPLRLEIVFILFLLGSIAATIFGLRKLNIYMALGAKSKVNAQEGTEITAKIATSGLTSKRELVISPPPGSILKEVVKFSGPLFFWNVFQKLAGRSQVVLASMFLSEADVGVFGLFLRLLLIFTFFQTAINQTAPVEFARLNHLGEFQQLRDLLQGTAKSLLITCILLSMPLVINPPVLLEFFGKDYSTQGWMLLPLVFAQVVNVGTGATGHLLISCRRQSSLLYVSLFSFGVQITLSLLLLPRLGLWGAVIAEVATNLTLTFGRQFLAFWLLRIHALTQDAFLLLLGGLLSALAGYQVATRLPGHYGYVSGVIVSLSCCSIFLGLYSFRDRPLQRQILGFLKVRGKR